MPRKQVSLESRSSKVFPTIGRETVPRQRSAVPSAPSPGSMSESEAELEHVRGYLPMWVGPPTDLARIQVSKSGRLLAYLDFEKRSFISLGRSPDKVRSGAPKMDLRRNSSFHWDLTCGIWMGWVLICSVDEVFKKNRDIFWGSTKVGGGTYL